MTGFVELGAKPVVQLVVKPQVQLSALDIKIRDMILAHAEGAKGVRLGLLGALMAKEHEIRLNTLDAKNWRAYLVNRPEIFELDPPSPNAHVRVRAAAAVRAA